MHCSGLGPNALHCGHPNDCFVCACVAQERFSALVEQPSLDAVLSSRDDILRWTEELQKVCHAVVWVCRSVLSLSIYLYYIALNPRWCFWRMCLRPYQYLVNLENFESTVPPVAPTREEAAGAAVAAAMPEPAIPGGGGAAAAALAQQPAAKGKGKGKGAKRKK